MKLLQKHSCPHPVIILKDVTYSTVAALIKFMYQGEVNVVQDDLSTFLKVAKMLQIKGLQSNSDDATIPLDTSEGEGSSSKASDRSTQSHRARKNTKKRKKNAVEDDCSSVKQSKRESNISKNDVVSVPDDDDEFNDNDEHAEKDVNDSSSEKDIEHEVSDISNDKEIIELPNESNTERNSISSGIIFYHYLRWITFLDVYKIFTLIIKLLYIKF